MTHDNEEPSAASAGSVAGDLRNGAPSGCETVRYDQGPVAWAVMPANSDYCVTLSARREAAQKAAERKVEVGEYATMDDIVVVPLYRHPPCQDFSQKNLTLTDAEREAIERAIKTLDGWQQTGGYHSAIEDDAAALRGLLKRTK